MMRFYFSIVLSVAAIVALAATIVIGAQASKNSSIRFQDITGRSGVDFVTDSSPTPNKNQPETMISGIGLFDYDNDGYLDIFIINGAAIPSLKKESPRYYNRLFHNNHDGTFTDVTERAGLGGDGYNMGVAIGDFDNAMDVALDTAMNYLEHTGQATKFPEVRRVAATAIVAAWKTGEKNPVKHLAIRAVERP